jgi:predicted amidohydrolase
MTRVAAIQMNSTEDVNANLRAAERLLEQAAQAGARLAVLPENFSFMGARDTDKLAHAEHEGRGPVQQFLVGISKRLQLWIIAGTMPMVVPDKPDKVHAACLVYDSMGQRIARYDKIHLFDVDVQREGNTESYRESAHIDFGALNPTTVTTPLGVFGLSVCYDLRFPELYRALSAKGAQLLTIPSAFTEKTGEAHWELLLRARAVENLCYVIAPNQCGTHPGSRRTWGHSMIVNPWGEVLTQRAEGEGVITADLDISRQAQIRSSFPSLTHRRL